MVHDAKTTQIHTPGMELDRLCFSYTQSRTNLGDGYFYTLMKKVIVYQKAEEIQTNPFHG